MKVQKVQVNPEILSWARQTAGLDVETAARQLGFKDGKKRTAVARLVALEAGAEAPSFSVLERMAEKYWRPLLAFYLPHPLEGEEPTAQFRSAPQHLSPAEAGRLNALVRDLRSRQSLLRDTLEDCGDAEPVAWIGSAAERDGRDALGRRLRQVLDLDLDEYRARPDAAAGFQLLRERAEGVGAYVLLEGDFGSWQSALDPELFRGLSLADRLAPFVVINPQDAKPAWSFTLLHEMTHLLLGQSELADSVSDNPLERLCDDVAGDLLLPAQDVAALVVLRDLGGDELDDKISEFATRWRVSNTLVAYRAFRCGYIHQDEFRRVRWRFRELWRTSKEKKKEVDAKSPGGPDYYVVRRHRLGASLLRRTRELWRTGELSTTQAGMVLGVRAISVHALLEPSHH